MSLKALLKPVVPQLPEILNQDEIELLRQVPVESLYLALKEADAEIVEWFFEAALPRQVQGLVDIDCWSGAEFLPERFEPYFKNLARLSPPKLAEYMRKLDSEIIVRGLLEYADVQDYDPQSPPKVAERQLVLSPDNKYVLILKSPDPEIRESIFQWLNRMAASDIELMRRILEALKWEQASDLEEFGYQMKKGRLEEMGFVDYHEAIALYARGSSKTLRNEMLASPISKGTKTSLYNANDEETPATLAEDLLPVQMFGPFREEGFFRESLAKVEDPRLREVLLMEFFRVLNMSLSADKLLHGELERIGLSSLRSRRYVDLGLSWLAEKNPERGAELLETQRIEQLFRLGWLLVQDLVQARNELVRNTLKGSLADLPQADREFLEALQGRHPNLDTRLLLDLGVPQASLPSATTPATIPSLESLLLAGLRLQQLASISRFFSESLGASLRLDVTPRTGGDGAYARLVTALFRQASGRPSASTEFSPAALGADEWSKLAPSFDAAAAVKLSDLVAARCPDPGKALLTKRLRASLEDLGFQIRNNPGRRPDPRFFSDLNLEPAK